MDVAYNQHSPHSRRGRSSTNLNHLSLAPLTSRLPLSDHDALPDAVHHVSYIEGRSAPTTPSILSRSPSRVSVQKPTHIKLPKSKSSTHLLANRHHHRSGTATPGGTKLRHGVTRDELGHNLLSVKDRNDSDWLLRAGTAISASTRESKGQAWLVSRASSTSLTGERDEDEVELELQLARERIHSSRGQSRRESGAGAFDADDEFSPITTRRSLSFGHGTGPGSRPLSRFGSRTNSRTGSRVHLFTPLAGPEREGYFNQGEIDREEFLAEPDFVDVEDSADEDDDDPRDDEAIVRKLSRANSLGLGGWVERMLGWSLFAVDEDGEESDNEAADEKLDDSEVSSKTSRRALEASLEARPEEPLPPPRDDEAGGWQDAAWLLSVATKVIL
jgi:hypothetical protein